MINLDYLPKDDDVLFYQEHGYWISPVILPDSVIDSAERGMKRLYAGDIDRPLPDGRREFGWAPADGDVLRKNDHASHRVDDLAPLVRNPLIGACAARLSGATEIRLWHDQLLYKPVEATAPSANVGWHTDRQYWGNCSSAAMLTAWVPFHDVDTTTGAISFVDGSHAWGEDIALDFFNPDLATLNSLGESRNFTVVETTIPRGAMSFHHCRTIHGSGPNRSDGPRRSIAIHLQPGDNHHVDWVLPDGEFVVHGLDRLVRRTADGAPDYADPVMCPRLWPS